MCKQIIIENTPCKIKEIEKYINSNFDCLVKQSKITNSRSKVEIECDDKDYGKIMFFIDRILGTN